MSKTDDTHARLVAAVRRASVAAASMGTRVADAFRKPQAPPPALPDSDRHPVNADRPLRRVDGTTLDRPPAPRCGRCEWCQVGALHCMGERLSQKTEGVERRAISEMCEPHNTRWCFYCHPRTS